MEAHQENINGGKASFNNGGSNNATNTRQSSTRWTPTTDQIRILKDLYYNNGVRSPTADQIQRISARLRQYGKIEGKNVFYWFQNHKARERQKKRFTSTTTTVNNNTINMQQQNNVHVVDHHLSAATSTHMSFKQVVDHSQNNSPHGPLKHNTTSGFSSSASQSSTGMITVGHNYGGGGGHASLNMEKSFRDCSISTNNGGGVMNHKIHNNLGWAGFDPYSSSNIFDQRNYSIDVEEIDDEEEDINIIEYHHHQVIGQELETLPLFPMHGEDINGGSCGGGGGGDGRFYGNPSSDHHHHYYGGGGSSRASFELSLNSYFSGF